MYAVVDYNALPRHSFTCQQGNTPLSEEGGVRKERAQKRICTRVASPSEEFEIVDKPNLSFLLAFICSSIHHSPPQKEAVLPPSCAVCSGSLRFLSYLPHRAPFMKETRKKEDNQQNQREDNKKGWCELQCRLPHLTQQPQQFLLFSLSFFFLLFTTSPSHPSRRNDREGGVQGIQKRQGSVHQPTPQKKKEKPRVRAPRGPH
jgi:hypothetical protein